MGLFCLVLGAGFVAHDVYAVNPDAAAAAGAAVAVQAEAGAEALTIVVEPPGEALRAVAREAAGARAAAALTDPPCPSTAERVMLLDGPERSVPDGMVHYTPRILDSGAGLGPEVSRTLREQVGLPVPRPVAPWRRPVSVLRLAGDVSVAALLAAVFRAPFTSWVHQGGAIYLATDDAGVLDLLRQAEGAARVVRDVPLGQLRLTDGAVPEGARALAPGLVLCPEDCAEGTAWNDRRFAPPG